MKKLYMLICMLSSIFCLSAQDNSTLLFEQFQDGIVIYKNGKQYKAALNYDFANKTFLFINPADNNKVNEFEEPEMVSAIKIDNRTFLPDKKGLVEVLQFNPLIQIQYTGRLELEGKNIGYGQKSTTSSVDSYSRFNMQTSESTVSSVQVEREKTLLRGINKSFNIEISKKKKSFSNEKQFLKLFPKQTELLQQYIQENNISFDNVEQVIDLCNYAYSIN